MPAGLTLNPDGTVTGTIDPSASQGGDDPVNNPGVYTVNVIVDDGTDQATVTLTIDVSNPPPVAEDDAIAADEDTPVSGSVFADNGNGADTDPDGDAITVSSVNGVAGNVGQPVAGSNGGVFTLNADGTYSFDPAGAFESLPVGVTATTAITYEVSDGEGGTDTATVNVTVTGVNDAPVALDDGPFDVPLTGAPVTLTPLANDSDVDGEPLTITEIDGAPVTPGGPAVPVAGGTVELLGDGTTLVFTPDFSQAGRSEFTYTVADPQGATDTATIALDVPILPNVEGPQSALLPREIPQDSPEFGSGGKGIVTDAVNGVGNLGGIDTDLSGEEIVGAAVNGLAGLRGLTRLDDPAGIIKAQIDNPAQLRGLLDEAVRRYGAAIASWGPEGLVGFRFRTDVDDVASVLDPSRTAQILIETLVRDRVLFIRLGNSIDPRLHGAVRSYTVLLADGSPLPMWIHHARDGALLAETPADVPTLELKIRVNLASGAYIEQLVRIDSSAGEITSLFVAEDNKGPGTFDEQLSRAGQAEAEDAQRLIDSLQVQGAQ